tara:strand:- start:255 stop:533 length:279 start_codon:yes stop_codon:yes gene_type:complete
VALGTITFGVNPDLEKKATRVLKHDRKVRGIKGVEALSEEYAWLTEQQLMLREDREIGNRLGYPDPEIVSGVYWRAYNPLFGKRPQRQLSEV